MLMIRSFLALARRYRLSQKGIIAIEFAFIFPVMVLMYFGMLDLIQFVSVNRRVAASSGAVSDLVTANDKVVTSAQITDYYNAAYLNMKPIPAGNIRVEVYNLRMVSGAPQLQWSRNSTGGPSCGAAPTGAGIPTVINNHDTVITRVCTSYEPFFGRFMGQTLLGTTSIKLTKTIYQRPRLNGQLNLT
jgi:Flp pilus assembly protein TadG